MSLSYSGFIRIENIRLKVKIKITILRKNKNGGFLNMGSFFIRTVLIFSILPFFSSFSLGGIKYYQHNKINNDGSVSVYVNYSAATNEVTKNKFLIGNFPFTVEAIGKYFSFPGLEIKKAYVYKDPQDENNTTVAIDFETKNFTKISEAKSFNEIEASLLNSDSGLVFSWYVPTNYIKSNLIDTYHFIVSSEPEIKSTNGLIRDKDINWFISGDKIDSRGYFVTTVKSDEITSSGDDNDKSKNNKGCGLFGFELPVILLGGLVLSYKFRKESK